MPMLKWRGLRWLVFLGALALDVLVFCVSDPFSPRSFMASGLAALIILAVVIEIALLFRARHRIQSALVGQEKVRYQVGRHVVSLLEAIAADRIAAAAMFWPAVIALFASVFASAAVWQGLASNGLENWQALAQYACVGFVPLLIAAPFAIEHVSEWRSHQYAVIIDAEMHKPSLLIHNGVLRYSLETVALDRTVTTFLRQSFWESLIAYGDLELRETAGGSDAERIKSVWRPRKLERQIRLAIRDARLGVAPD